MILNTFKNNKLCKIILVIAILCLFSVEVRALAPKAAGSAPLFKHNVPFNIPEDLNPALYVLATLGINKNDLIVPGASGPLTEVEFTIKTKAVLKIIQSLFVVNSGRALEIAKRYGTSRDYALISDMKKINLGDNFQVLCANGSPIGIVYNGMLIWLLPVDIPELIDRRYVIIDQAEPLTSKFGSISSGLIKFPGVFPPAEDFIEHIETRGVQKALDFGCGNGILTVVLAKLGISVLAIDIDPLALAATLYNIRIAGVEDKVTVLESDLFSRVPDGEKFDAIYCYPPQGDRAPQTYQQAAVSDPSIKMFNDLIIEGRLFVADGGTIQYLWVREGIIKLRSSDFEKYGLKLIARKPIHIPLSPTLEASIGPLFKHLFILKLLEDNELEPEARIDVATSSLAPKAASERVGEATHRYYILYKPRGVLSLPEDDKRTTIFDMAHQAGFDPKGLVPIGRLDYNVSGVMVLTDDDALIGLLVLPAGHVTKHYRVTVQGIITPDEIEQLEQGVEITGRRSGQRETYLTKPAKAVNRPELVSSVNSTRALSVVDLYLQEGKYHQVKKMMAAVGHPVISLTRVSLGPISIQGMQPGEIRPLTDEELASLKDAQHQAERNFKKLERDNFPRVVRQYCGLLHFDEKAVRDFAREQLMRLAQKKPAKTIGNMALFLNDEKDDYAEAVLMPLMVDMLVATKSRAAIAKLEEIYRQFPASRPDYDLVTGRIKRLIVISQEQMDPEDLEELSITGLIRILRWAQAKEKQCEAAVVIVGIVSDPLKTLRQELYRPDNPPLARYAACVGLFQVKGGATIVDQARADKNIEVREAAQAAVRDHPEIRKALAVAQKEQERVNGQLKQGHGELLTFDEIKARVERMLSENTRTQKMVISVAVVVHKAGLPVNKNKVRQIATELAGLMRGGCSKGQAVANLIRKYNPDAPLVEPKNDVATSSLAPKAAVERVEKWSHLSGKSQVGAHPCVRPKRSINYNEK